MRLSWDSAGNIVFVSTGHSFRNVNRTGGIESLLGLSWVDLAAIFTTTPLALMAAAQLLLALSIALDLSCFVYKALNRHCMPTSQTYSDLSSARLRLVFALVAEIQAFVLAFMPSLTVFQAPGLTVASGVFLSSVNSVAQRFTTVTAVHSHSAQFPATSFCDLIKVFHSLYLGLFLVVIAFQS